MSQKGDASSTAGSATGSNLRMATIMQKEAEQYLKEKNVPIMEPIMADRRGEVRQGDIELTTNVYPATMPPQLTVYRYDVEIIGVKARSGREVMFTKKFKDDFTITDRRFRCRDVVCTFMKDGRFRDIAQEAGCMYHDLQSIMYTLRPFSGQGDVCEFEFSTAELHNAEEFEQHKLSKVKLLFKKTKDFVMNLSEMTTQMQSNLLFVNRDLAQFLDIATSQEVFFREGEHVHFSASNSYMYDPIMFGFREDDSCTFEENATYLGIGCQKAIHTLQGQRQGSSQSQGVPAVIVQPKKTPFHADAMLAAKIEAMLKNFRGDRDKMVFLLDKQLKGLFVRTTHNPKNVQIFPIKCFTRDTPVTKQIDVDGELVSVAHYFQTKYKYPLSHPDWPLVVVDSKDKAGKTQKNYFPIDVLQVCDNQRVKTSQMTSTMTQQSIRKCAVPPAILQEQVRKTANSLHLWDSEYLDAAQIKIMNQPLKVFAHQLEAPTIESGDGVRPTDQQALWRVNRVLHPQKVVGHEYGWAVFAFGMQGDRGVLPQRDINEFVDRFCAAAHQRGINIGQPAKQEIVFANPISEVARRFEWAAQQNLAFLLCFHGDSDDFMHNEIKANERRYLVISQCVKMGTARNVLAKNQRLTMDNILNKTNVKLGGLNYNLARSPIANDRTTLVIGFSSNHPAGGMGAGDDGTSSNPNRPPSYVAGPPSVVGFAANVGPTNLPYDFVGDFVYQVSRREEKVMVIDTIVQRCLHFFKATRDGNLPQKVIIYRNGCSEGQFASILKYEVPLLKEALHSEGCDAHLTLIVCNKLQNVRFFNTRIDPRAKPTDQNLKPGITIDSGAVHPKFAEFFLNSHRALQGTARTPKYTLLYDDNGFDFQQLEKMTYDLCFGHQIVFSPLSLPCAVYTAAEYAKRGRNLYNAMFEELKRNNPTIRYEHLNEQLSFYGQSGTECWFAEYRVNA